MSISQTGRVLSNRSMQKILTDDDSSENEVFLGFTGIFFV